MAETSKPTPTSYPPIVKLKLEVTLEQAAILYRGLVALRASAAFAINATGATEDERDQGKRDLMVIDRLKGMFE